MQLCQMLGSGSGGTGSSVEVQTKGTQHVSGGLSIVKKPEAVAQLFGAREQGLLLAIPIQ